MTAAVPDGCSWFAVLDVMKIGAPPLAVPDLGCARMRYGDVQCSVALDALLKAV